MQKFRKDWIFFMKRNLRCMYAIALLQGMVFYGPVATLYREAQGVSIAQITLIESLSLALCILLEVPWGILADRLGYKRTMIGCCFLYFLSKIVFWQADGFGGFLLERVMLSVVVAGMSGVDTSILYLSRGGQDSQQVFGWYNSLQTAGLLIAALTFSLFVGDNYALAGGLTVLSYGAAALCALGLTEVKAPAPFSPRLTLDILRQTLTNRRLLLFLLSAALLSEAHQTITTFLNQLQYARAGLPDWAIGALYIAATVLGMAGIWSARLTRRTGTVGTAVLLYGGGVLACIALALTAAPLPSICAILTLRLCNTLCQPFLMELQNKQVTTPHRATALSVQAMIIDGVGVGTNLAFGALAEINLDWSFWLGGGICLAGLLLFMIWYKLRPRA